MQAETGIGEGEGVPVIGVVTGSSGGLPTFAALVTSGSNAQEFANSWPVHDS